MVENKDKKPIDNVKQKRYPNTIPATARPMTKAEKDEQYAESRIKQSPLKVNEQKVIAEIGIFAEQFEDVVLVERVTYASPISISHSPSSEGTPGSPGREEEPPEVTRG